jgi:hypothetical protein
MVARSKTRPGPGRRAGRPLGGLRSATRPR